MTRAPSLATAELVTRPRAARSGKHQEASRLRVGPPALDRMTCQGSAPQWVDNSSSESDAPPERMEASAAVSRPTAADVVRDYATRIYGLARLMLGNDA